MKREAGAIPRRCPAATVSEARSNRSPLCRIRHGSAEGVAPHWDESPAREPGNRPGPLVRSAVSRRAVPGPLARLPRSLPTHLMPGLNGRTRASGMAAPALMVQGTGHRMKREAGVAPGMKVPLASPETGLGRSIGGIAEGGTGALARLPRSLPTHLMLLR